MAQQQVSSQQISGTGSSNGQVLMANTTGGVSWTYVTASTPGINVLGKYIAMSIVFGGWFING